VNREEEEASEVVFLTLGACLRQTATMPPRLRDATGGDSSVGAAGVSSREGILGGADGEHKSKQI